MAYGKKRKNAFGNSLAGSKICNFFTKIANYLFSKAESSITGKIFSSYDDGSGNGLINWFCKKLDLENLLFRRVKRGISRAFSRSVLLKCANGYLQKFLYTKLNVYGLFLIIVGIGSALLHVLKGYVLGQQVLSFLDIFASLLLVIVSLPLLFSNSHLTASVCKSSFASSIVFDWLGCDREVFENDADKTGHSRTALPAGVLFCFLSWWIRPVWLILLTILLVYLLIVLYTPETGIVGFFLILPFVPADMSAILVVYTFISFGLKYIRGKRTLRFDTLAVAVLMFFVIMIFGRYAFIGRRMMVYACCCIGVFFLTVNLIKSKKWVSRCVMSLISSCLFTSLYGCVRYVVSRLGNGYFMRLFNCGETEEMVSVFGDTANFSAYLCVVILFAVVGMNSLKKGIRIISFTSFVTSLLCLFFTFEYNAWMSVLAGALLFMLLYKRKTLAITLATLCGLPFVLLNLPKGATGGINNILNSIADYVRNIFLSDGTDILSRVGLGFGAYEKVQGVGWGNGNGIIYRLRSELGIIGVIMFAVILFLCIQKNTTMYSKGCSSYGKLVSLASVSSIISLSCLGIGVNVFENFAVCVMFWLCLGLSSSISETERGTMMRLEEINGTNWGDGFEFRK